MKSVTLLGFALTFTVGISQAQATTSCVLAGRINEAGQWAPQMSGVRLLDATGKPVNGTAATAIEQVKQVSVSKAVPLSICHGQNTALPEMKEATGSAREKSQHLSAGPQPLAVAAVYRPVMRTGGSLVELQIEVPSNRVVLR